MDWDGRSVGDGVRSLKGVIQSATIILACMWVGDYCMTPKAIHNGQGHSTGQSVANRSPAGTRWPDEDGVLSRRVSGSQRGKVTERCAFIENQAKIAKSWVEIRDFNHWCHAASELVDLTNHLVYMENSLLYYEGLISKNERLRHCLQFSSQLVDLVSFSMFERALSHLEMVSSWFMDFSVNSG